MVSRTKLVTGAAAVVTAGSLAFAGATLAQADAPTGNASGNSSSSQQGAGGQESQGDQGGRGFGGRGGHAHTAVTGDEKTKVTQAVTAKDSGVKVEDVRKDADGSYDVMGTKDGSRVMVEVSKDLKTVEVRTGGPGGPGGAGDQGAPGAPGADRQAPSEAGTPGSATVPSTGTSPTDIPSTQAA